MQSNAFAVKYNLLPLHSGFSLYHYYLLAMLTVHLTSRPLWYVELQSTHLENLCTPNWSSMFYSSSFKGNKHHHSLYQA